MRVLVIAPHPDDEVLGCGGTMLKEVRRGADVDVFWVTGTNAVDPEAVARAMGLRDTFGASLQDHCVHDKRAWVIGELRAYTKGYGPYDRVYLPYRHDPIQDHRAAFYAALAVVKRWDGEILEYEVPSQTEHAAVPFQPNVIETIDAEAKARLFEELYPDQITDERNAGAILALAKMRGGEAFRLVRCRR